MQYKVLFNTITADNVVISGAAEATEPDAPTDLAAVPSSTEMALTWTAPANNGGATITDYVVEYKLASEPTTWTTFNDGVSSDASATVTGLTNDLSYDFRVAATNSVGTGAYSESVTATPALSVPSVPRSLTATAGNGQAALSWTAPLSNGGAVITDYIVEYKLASEPTTWTTFNDGVSTETTVNVTSLVNNSSYNFRVSATNSVGTSVVSNTATVTPVAVTFVDNFTGTTIDTDKWTETDATGVGGTSGRVQQNGALNITPSAGAWSSQDGVSSVATFDRTNGDVSMQVSITRDTCGSGVGPVALGYGDFNFTTVGSASYILLSNTTNWELYYWLNGTNQASSPVILSGLSSCTNGVPIVFELVALQAGGAKVYVNGSDTPAATYNLGTFTDKSFWIGGYQAGGTVSYDDVTIIEPVTGPFAPNSLSATPGSGQVALTWVSGGDNGAEITDYVVEYKQASAGSWSTFADGTSDVAAATVTGLSNGVSYNFRVSATNANGNSDPSNPTTSMPISATPTAPTASSVTITGTASVGELLTGAYTFIDINGNSEATSLYRWLRADSADGTYAAIGGATSASYTVVSADLNKYLKFEVTPVANVSPSTGVAVLSSATAQVNEVDYINQILSTGQSLSVGVNSTPALTTTQPYSNLMLSGGNGGLGAGTSFIPLVEASVQTISSPMANTITANDAGNDFDVAVSLHGVSGYTYSQLKKGTGPYSTAMTQVTNAKNAATALGRVSRVIGVTTIHGETDNYNGVSGPTYQGYLEEWQNDYETDAKAITGQSGDIPLFLCQMSSFMSSYANDATSAIPIYQLAAAEDNPGDIVLVAPKYFFNYSDRHHLTGASSRWLGEYYGKVIKKVSADHEAWRPLSPDTIVRSANIIYADFHVPAGELAFDTTLVSARTNYGFEYYDTTASASISSVEILDTDTVKITLSGTPTGANQRLRYAYTGVPGTDTGSHNAGSAAGNLRDTDPYPSLYGNTLYNWAVHFDKAITADATAPTILSVSSDKANGSYKVGETIDIDLTFSEEVTSDGNVTVTLETGATDRTCTFSVSGETTATCNYTVQTGDTSSALTVSNVEGDLVDPEDNPMVNFTPVTNLAANKNIIIDTTSSEITSVLATPLETSSSITWTTNEAASSIVDLGFNNNYASSTTETDTDSRVTNHTVNLTNLLSCTTYHYRVKSKDTALNLATSADNNFTTLGCAGDATVEETMNETVATSTGATVNLDTGTADITLDIPAGFDEDGESDVEFQVNQLNAEEVVLSLGTPTNLEVIGGHTYDLSAFIDIDTVLDTFDAPLTLTIHYTDEEVSGMDEASLTMYYWNSTAWEALIGCTVDTQANTLTCTTTHFSTFAVFGEEEVVVEEISPTVSGGGATIIIPSQGQGKTDIHIEMNKAKDITLTDSTNFLMYINSQVNFTLNNLNYNLKVTDLDLVNFKAQISIANSTIYLAPGQFALIDLNEDKVNDLQLSFNTLLNNRLDLTLSTLNKDLLVKEKNSSTVYLLENNTKRPIPNETIFLSYNFKWSDIKVYDNLDQYTTGETLGYASTSFTENSLVKEKNNPAVYLIDDNKKRLIPNESIFLSYNFKWSDIIEVDSLSSYPQGQELDSKLSASQTKFTRTLSLNATGTDVRLLQTILSQDKEVYPEGKVTGIFGPLTQQAVQRFQLKHKIVNSANDTGYGLVGPKTREQLNGM
ncbi:fibronectin type III domain-containing protein [Patescibacteria group bacterium]|nr:fibronectin type III domain-containing protein [Patescibacteria group bacterium]